MPVKPCLEAGCPNYAEPKGRGRCRKHNRDREQAINRKGHSVYRSKAWRILRRRVLFDEPMCRQCVSQQLQELATEVDHINGDPTDNRRENLQPLCKPCHSAKTRNEMKGAA